MKLNSTWRITLQNRRTPQRGDAILLFRFIDGALSVEIGGDDSGAAGECAHECASMYMEYVEQNLDNDLLYMFPKGES